jgi:hypothetical protein
MTSRGCSHWFGRPYGDALVSYGRSAHVQALKRSPHSPRLSIHNINDETTAQGPPHTQKSPVQYPSLFTEMRNARWRKKRQKGYRAGPRAYFCRLFLANNNNNAQKKEKKQRRKQ